MYVLMKAAAARSIGLSAIFLFKRPFSNVFIEMLNILIWIQMNQRMMISEQEPEPGRKKYPHRNKALTLLKIGFSIFDSNQKVLTLFKHPPTNLIKKFKRE